MTIDTDWIAGYADGELEPERRRQVSAALARDPSLASALRREREMSTLLAAAFRPVDDPPPAAVAALLAAPALPSRAAHRRRTGVRWVAALAAAVAVAFIGAGGWTALHVIDGLEGRIARVEATEQQRQVSRAAITSGRAEALERSPNGVEMPWHNGDVAGRVKPVSTFIDGSGRFCREFTEAIDGPDGQRTGGGIACRVGQRDWRMWWPGDGGAPGGQEL